MAYYYFIAAAFAPMSFDFLIRPIRYVRGGGVAVEFLDGDE